MLAKRQITVERQKLLDHLKRNRETHLAMHNEAMEGYCINAKKCLNNMQQELEENPTKFDHNKYLKELERPKFYGQQYNRAISMLEWSTEEKITINHNQFDSWIRDKWGWKKEWLVLNSLHRSRAGYKIEEEIDDDPEEYWD